MKRVFLLLPLFSQLMGEPLTLSVDPDNITSITYTTLSGVAVAQNTTTGTVELDITLDPITQKPTAVTFTGGTLFYSDSNSLYTPNAPPPVESLIINTANNSGTLATINPNSPIDPLTGALTNEDHTTAINDGTLFFDYQLIIGGVSTTFPTTTIDFTEEPQISPFFGQNTLTSSLFNSTPLHDTYQITLETTADPSPTDLSDLGLNLTVSAVGGFSANGFITKPSAAFTTWSASHQPAANPPEIIYALGLPPEENKLPLTITPGEITLAIPETGSLLPIIIQHSTNLQNWTTLQSIPAKSAGITNIPSPETPSGFVRLAIE